MSLRGIIQILPLSPYLKRSWRLKNRLHSSRLGQKPRPSLNSEKHRSPAAPFRWVPCITQSWIYFSISRLWVVSLGSGLGLGICKNPQNSMVQPRVRPTAAGQPWVESQLVPCERRCLLQKINKPLNPSPYILHVPFILQGFLGNGF